MGPGDAQEVQREGLGLGLQFAHEALVQFLPQEELVDLRWPGLGDPVLRIVGGAAFQQALVGVLVREFHQQAAMPPQTLHHAVRVLRARAVHVEREVNVVEQLQLIPLVVNPGRSGAVGHAQRWHAPLRPGHRVDLALAQQNRALLPGGLRQGLPAEEARGASCILPDAFPRTQTAFTGSRNRPVGAVHQRAIRRMTGKDQRPGGRQPLHAEATHHRRIQPALELQVPA